MNEDSVEEAFDLLSEKSISDKIIEIDSKIKFHNQKLLELELKKRKLQSTCDHEFTYTQSFFKCRKCGYTKSMFRR